MSHSIENFQEHGLPEVVAQYVPNAGAFDEMVDAQGRPRPAWQAFARSLDDLGSPGIAPYFEQTRRLLRDNGVRFPSLGTSRGFEEYGELDPIPWLLAKNQWASLAAGVAQRARLFNAIHADLYGPQELLRRGLLPPALVFGQPGFLLPCHGILAPKDIYLHLYAGELARGVDGQWLVLADRVQWPAGAGLAVENRIILSRILPTYFHELHVERLASFFLTLRQTLQSLAPQHRDNPRIALLSSGPRSSRYFEDTYLARYLGYTLVEGGDLTVRGSAVYLKTLGGLLPVDVILRRQADAACDPLELDGASSLGVPGLVQAVRTGQVLVANALGSGCLETPALLAFLPELCRHLLGEELQLPSVPTWWCGRESDWREVEQRFDDLVIEPAVRNLNRTPTLTAELDRRERSALLETVRAQPTRYVAHARIVSSTVPVWSDGGLRPRHATLRAFAVAGDGGYQVMPGGLARISPTDSVRFEWTAAGQTNKDVWILSDRPVAPVSLLRSQGPALEIRRSGNDLPSRVADNLYWLGRHLERAEGMVRLLRTCVVRTTSEVEPQDLAQLAMLVQCLSENSLLESSGDWSDAGGLLPRLQAEVVSFLFDETRVGDFASTVRAAYQTAAVVRDRLSVDTWRMINQLDIDLLFPRHRDQLRLGDLLLSLNQTLNLLAGLSGLAVESMTRGPGWRFLDLGRRLERAMHTLRLLDKTVVPAAADPATLLEALLEIADSSMTYRYRYLTSLHLAPVLDLLLTDETNPRSVGYQLSALSAHVSQLPHDSVDPLRTPEMRLVLALQTSMRLTDVEILATANSQGDRPELRELLQQALERLRQLSEVIARTHLTHTRPSRQLGSCAPGALP